MQQNIISKGVRINNEVTSFVYFSKFLFLGRGIFHLLSNKLFLNLCACYCISFIFKLLLLLFLFTIFVFRKQRSNVYCYQRHSSIKHCLHISVEIFLKKYLFEKKIIGEERRLFGMEKYINENSSLLFYYIYIILALKSMGFIT